MTTKYDIYTYPANGKGSWILDKLVDPFTAPLQCRRVCVCV